MFYNNAPMVIVGMLALVSCGGEPQAAKSADSTPVRVTVSTATEVDWPETIEAPGTVRARTAATISSRAMGYIREVRAREGDGVAAGTLLVTLEARELQVSQEQAMATVEEARLAIPEAESAIQSATAQLELAQTTLGRMQDLLDKRSVSHQEFDEAAARTKVAQSAREMAVARRRQLDQRIRQAEQALAASEVQTAYLEVRAPFAGRIVTRHAEPGMLASPGLPLFEMEREGSYRLEAAVPEAQLHAIRQGSAVEVRLDAVASPLEGRVDEIAPEIDPASRTFLVKIELPSRAAVRTGMFGRAIFASGTRKVLAIPKPAVTEHGQLREVLIAADGVARLRLVRVGEEREGNVELLSGLDPGESVISAHVAGLRDGQRVEVSR